MERIKVEAIDFTDHEIKCRFCFKSFGVNEHRVEISKLIEKRFKEITQTNLKTSDEFSKELCVICNYQLTNCWQFKRNIVKSQSCLYKYAASSENTRPECEMLIMQEYEAFKNENDYANIELNEYDPIEELESSTDYLKQESASELENETSKTDDTGGHLENLERRRHYGKLGDNKCPHCDVRIINRSQLKRHIERVHCKIKNFRCDVCGYESYFKYVLRSHMNTHIEREKRRSIACDKCDFVTVSKDSLRSHYSIHHMVSKSQECLECKQQFENYNQLYRHRLKVHNEMEKYVCSHCRKSLKGASALKNHITLFHSGETPSLTCPWTISGCDKVCLTIKQLQNHIKTHNEDAKEICPECGLCLANKHNLEKHINRVHLKLRNFACDLCDYRGFFKFNIVEHMKKHLDLTEREKHYCDEESCSFQTVSKTSLRAHKRLEHLGQKRNYICHCGKVFTQNSSYYTHVKIVHEKLKRHSCKLCSKAFFEKAQLKNHIKSQHLKQKDLPCEICQKMFSTRKHLQSHMKYHIAPRFLCNISDCTNAFYTLSQLNSHIKVHNNQRDFVCHIVTCQKSYFHKSHLKKHLLTHGIT